MEHKSLSDILQQSSILTGTGAEGQFKATSDSKTLEDILQARLEHFRTASGRTVEPEVPQTQLSFEEVQFETAFAALECLESIQEILASIPHDHNTHDGRGFPEGLTVGGRDLAQIRTLLSLVFKWALESLLPNIIAALPTHATPRRHQSASIIDLTSVPNDYNVVSSALNRLYRILLPLGIQSSLSHSIVTANILSQHLSILLKASLILGWLPRPIASESMRVQDHLRPLVLHILASSVFAFREPPHALRLLDLTEFLSPKLSTPLGRLYKTRNSPHTLRRLVRTS